MNHSPRHSITKIAALSFNDGELGAMDVEIIGVGDWECLKKLSHHQNNNYCAGIGQLTENQARQLSGGTEKTVQI